MTGRYVVLLRMRAIVARLKEKLDAEGREVKGKT